MKHKLWVGWGIMGILTIIAGLADNVIAAYTFAIICAIFGWAAFFVYD